MSISHILNRKNLLFSLAFIVLNVILILPSQLLPVKTPSILKASSGFRMLFTHIWVSVDLLIIITIIFFIRKQNKFRLLKWVLITIFLFVFSYELYEIIILLFYRRSPVLYNDIMLFLDGFNLFIALIPEKWPFMLLLTMIFGLLFFWLIPLLFSYLKNQFSQVYNSKFMWALILFIWITVLFFHLENGITERDTATQFILGRFSKNISLSTDLYNELKTIQKMEPDSSYHKLDQLMLDKKPNIYIFFIESYGKILATRDEYRDTYADYLYDIEQRLKEDGWDMRSNYSAPPVRGGASWLSASSMLGGIRLENVRLYHRYNSRQNPNMVQFFNKLGYTTIKLQPANRERPGRPLSNYFGFDIALSFDDMNYHGTQYGWTSVPDQYSIHYTHKHYLSIQKNPILLFFPTVSSHAPWTHLPDYHQNWETIGMPDSVREISSAKNESFFTAIVKKIANIFKRKWTRPVHTGNYLKLMFYELRILDEFIRTKIPDNSLVVILGDHQPPLLLNDEDTEDTPIHILSKNRDLINLFNNYGFVEGLFKNPLSDDIIKHEAIFSLLVNVLFDYNYPDKTDSVDYYLKDGISISLLK